MAPESSEFKIDVASNVDIVLPAERAVLSMAVNAQGKQKKEVTDCVLTSARTVERYLRETATSRGEESSIDYWSRTSVSEKSNVPYDHQRKVELPRVYSASVDFKIQLQSFSFLGETIRDLVAIDYVSSQGVQWVLTDATMEAQRSKLRLLAAKDAFTKAQDYAVALGYGKVIPVEVQEKGSHVSRSDRKRVIVPSEGLQSQSTNRATAEEWENLGNESFQYIPEEVKMIQQVNAHFIAEKA